MNYLVRLREEAEFDLAEAAEWYELQRVGLGHEFLDEVSSTLDIIGVRPLAYPAVYRDTHRALIQRFPFGVFYRVTATNVVVVAILHGSRHPEKWQNRT